MKIVACKNVLAVLPSLRILNQSRQPKPPRQPNR
jgi:hypothetical protein